ncbi:helix-turn-helix domain-containing protein [Lysinibacillus sphaericus]|uniref:helix-turn-helix domain-containing protein n=1 Tax=Lysinibacillus sphaericus TaxID=1421 RepID=UPI003F79C472
MISENSFGDFLREYRKGNDLSTNDLHKITGVSQPYLSQLENGKKPSKKMIHKIASGLTKNNQSEFKKLYKELLSAAGYNVEQYFFNEIDDLYKNKIEKVTDEIALLEYNEKAFEEGSSIPIFVDDYNNVNIKIYKNESYLNKEDTESLKAMIKGFLYDKKFIDYREEQ